VVRPPSSHSSILLIGKVLISESQDSSESEERNSRATLISLRFIAATFPNAKLKRFAGFFRGNLAARHQIDLTLALLTKHGTCMRSGDEDPLHNVRGTRRGSCSLKLYLSVDLNVRLLRSASSLKQKD
jgi:hypothetical protein